MYNLHDATFISEKMNWESGEVVLRFQTCEKTSKIIEIIAMNLIFFCCPRRFPWGRSISVNKISEYENIGISNKVEIEMQSGDVIEIEAEQIYIRKKNMVHR